MQHPRLTRRFNVRIPLRDGVSLAADLVLPDVLPAPVVVTRTPYGRSGETQTKRADVFARAGYCACWVDVRGRGDSEGAFDPYRNDGLDGVDVIAWAAGQDWCDGSVATWGGSYAGRIQWLTALHRPPALKAMIVVVPPSDPFVENPTGVPSPMHIHWFRMTDGHAMQYTEAVDWMEVYRHRPLIELDEAAGFRSELWREECRHQTLDAWWEAVRYQHRIGEVDVPVLHISGWYDDEEIGTPANFAAMRAAARAGQRLLMGPWGHQVNASTTFGELDFGNDAVIDLNAAMTGFLDETVRHSPPAEPPPPVRLFLMAANEWLDLDDWPAPGSAEAAWYLDSECRANSSYGDGRLRDGPVSTESSRDAWVHDPDRPVPFVTPSSSAQIGGPDDYSGVDIRADVLVYTSEPLTEPLDVIGPVRAVLFVSTSAGDTDVTARLIDLHPNGFAQRLCDGLVRLRYRAGHDRPQPVVPDTVYEVEVVMWDTAQRFLPGHCIRLAVASSAHPKFAVNLGAGDDESTATTAVVAHNRLYHDAARPSRLLLSVLPGRTADDSA
ncbi:MAG TPA: CocE/NonD family hydrolase [Solirubrobacteraceae bacterium]|nr:CocE/NonD family hydrolase [Solirubrobacteraceae bacterium]